VLRCGGTWAALSALLVTGTTASGQVSLGAHGDWGTDTSLGIGARAIVDLGSLLDRLEVTGYADRYFPDDSWGTETRAWEAGLNLVYRLLGSDRTVVPYAGVGLSYARFDASTRLLGSEIEAGETTGGVNALAGLVWMTGRLAPFLEGRLLSSDAGQFIVAAGARVRLSGP
jgi:hypothetical protein